MTRKKFVKMLMAHGISRDTANMAARKAQERGLPYFKELGNWLNFWGMMGWARRKMAEDCLLYGYAEIPSFLVKNLHLPETPKTIITTRTPEYMLRACELMGLDLASGPDYSAVAPLRPKHDGYKIDFSAVDEVHQWPKENPHIQGGGGNA